MSDKPPTFSWMSEDRTTIVTNPVLNLDGVAMDLSWRHWRLMPKHLALLEALGADKIYARSNSLDDLSILDTNGVWWQVLVSSNSAALFSTNGLASNVSTAVDVALKAFTEPNWPLVDISANTHMGAMEQDAPKLSPIKRDVVLGEHQSNLR